MIFKKVCLQDLFDKSSGGSTRPLARDGGAEKLSGDPTVEPHLKVKNRERGAKDRFT